MRDKRQTQHSTVINLQINDIQPFIRVINILHLIATLEVGGAEKQLASLVKRIDRTRYNPTVCCLVKGGPFEKEFREAGIRYFVLGKQFKFDFTVIFKLISLIRQEKPDILHTWMFTSNSFGRITGIIARVPIIISSEMCIDIWKNRFHFFLDSLLSYFTARIVCVSEGVKEFYREHTFIPHGKLITIYNGVETVGETNIVVEKKKKEFGLRHENIVITTIGRMAQQKGIKYLLYAVPKVIENVPEARFLIVGEGREKEKLENILCNLNIHEYVIMSGLRADVKEILSFTDIFVLPSLFEGLPNVIMEAMAARKPVIATRIHGSDELVVNNETGILVPPRNPGALVDAIINLLNDTERTRRMGIAGRKRVEKYFNVDSMVKKHENLYNELTQKCGRIFKKPNNET